MSSFRRVTHKKTVLFLRFAIVSVSCLPSQSSPIFIKSKIGSSKFETKYLLPTRKIINFQEEFSANCTYYRESTKNRALDIGHGNEYLPKALNFSLEQERSTNKKRSKIEKIGKAKIETTDYIGIHEPLLKMIKFQLKNPKKHTSTPFLVVSIQIFADNISKSVPLLKTLSVQLQVKQFLKKQKVKLDKTKKLKANDRKNSKESNHKINGITTGSDTIATVTTATTASTTTATDSKIKEFNTKHKPYKITSKHRIKKHESKSQVNLHTVTNTKSFQEKDLEDIILEQYTFNQTTNRSEYYTAFTNNSVTSFGSDLASLRESIRSEKPLFKQDSVQRFSFKGEHGKTKFKNGDEMKLKQLKNEISKKRKIISQKKRIISEFEYARQNMKKFKKQQKHKYRKLDQQKKKIINFQKKLDQNKFLVRRIKKKFHDYNSEVKSTPIRIFKNPEKKSILESYNSKNNKKSKDDSEKEKQIKKEKKIEKENELEKENEIQKENENKKENEIQKENELQKENEKSAEKKIENKERKAPQTDKKEKVWNLNSETEKEIIREQKKRLKEQKYEIHDIFKKLEIQQNIEKEKWLIERMFFFFTDIQSGEYPLPSSILIKFFIQSNSFADGYEEVLNTYIDSFNLLLFINRNNKKKKSRNIYTKDNSSSNVSSRSININSNSINTHSNSNNTHNNNNSNNSSSNNNNNNNNTSNPSTKRKLYLSKYNSHNNIYKILNYKPLSQSLSLQDVHSLGKVTPMASSQSYLTFNSYLTTSEYETPSTEFLIEGKIPPVIVLHEQLCKLLHQVYLKIQYMINEQLLPRVRKIFLKVYNSESKEFAQILSYFTRSMIKHLKLFINLCKLTKLPQAICKVTIDQTVYSINAIIFNCFLQKKEMCTIGHSVKIKESLSQIEKYLDTTPFKKSKSQLNPVYNLIDLILMNKVVLKDQENDYFLCTNILNSISLYQIHHILSNFTPDEFDSAKINKNELDALLKFTQKRFARFSETKKIRMDVNRLIPFEIDFIETDCKNWHLFKLPEQLQKEINTSLFN